MLGTADTILIAYLITQNTTHALSIGGAEVITKMLLFFLHERIWLRFGNGKESRLRSFTKAITWRLTGTLDTIILSFLIIMIGTETREIKNPFYQASAIGSIELFTKIILYYLHERVWNKIKFGLRD